MRKCRYLALGVVLAAGNTNYKAVDGILYSSDGKEMLAVPRNKAFENGVYEIPEGVTFLGELSFSRNYNIHTLVLPDSYEIRYVPVYDEEYIVFALDAEGNLQKKIKAGPIITLQPMDCVTPIGEMFRMELKAEGEGLDFQWYYKDKGMETFEQSCDTRPSYSWPMTTYRDGRQVYCVVTDMFGNQVITEVATIILKKD